MRGTNSNTVECDYADYKDIEIDILGLVEQIEIFSEFKDDTKYRITEAGREVKIYEIENPTAQIEDGLAIFYDLAGVISDNNGMLNMFYITQIDKVTHEWLPGGSYQAEILFANGSKIRIESL